MKYFALTLVITINLSACVQTDQTQQGSSASINRASINRASIDRVLDSYHLAAANAEWDRYFDLMSVDSVFIGTDAAERWTKNEFQQYASASQGWRYTPQRRHINMTPDGNSAWFDEILLSEGFGSSRGSGIAVTRFARFSMAWSTLPCRAIHTTIMRKVSRPLL